VLTAGLGRTGVALRDTEHFVGLRRPQNRVVIAAARTIRHCCACQQVGVIENWPDRAKRTDWIGGDDENIRFVGANVVPVHFRDTCQVNGQPLFECHDCVKVFERATAKLKDELVLHALFVRPNELANRRPPAG
jgi:hypothetical protein